MNALLCPDCLARSCDCAPRAIAANGTVAALAADAYDRAGGDSVLAVLFTRTLYGLFPEIDEADLVDRCQRWLVDGMGPPQRVQLHGVEEDMPVYLRIAEARHRRALAVATITRREAA